MPAGDEDPIAMLQVARDKAQKLINDLLVRQADLEQNPPELSPEDLREGQRALQNAIDAAQRMLRNIDDALAHPPGSTDD